MSTLIMTPICSTKAYAWNAYVRGVVNLDWPKKDITWLFVVQEQGLEDRLLQQILELQSRLGDQYAAIETVHYRLPFPDELFDPRSTHLRWEHRAHFAAHLRAVGFRAAQELAPDFTHLLSLGCDVCLNNPADLGRLVAVKQSLVSGVILARVRGFPLVLNYHPEYLTEGLPWESWVTHPKDAPFVADWTGLDILLMERRLTQEIDLFQFTPEEYGIGEDGWFCLKAKALGVPTTVNPKVNPIHVHQQGKALWALGEILPTGWKIRCDRCGAERVMSASYCDADSHCIQCHFLQEHAPWWKPLPENAPSIGQPISSSFS